MISGPPRFEQGAASAIDECLRRPGRRQARRGPQSTQELEGANGPLPVADPLGERARRMIRRSEGLE
jgi:hypothetical protein